MLTLARWLIYTCLTGFLREFLKDVHNCLESLMLTCCTKTKEERVTITSSHSVLVLICRCELNLWIFHLLVTRCGFSCTQYINITKWFTYCLWTQARWYALIIIKLTCTDWYFFFLILPFCLLSLYSCLWSIKAYESEAKLFFSPPCRNFICAMMD